MTFMTDSMRQLRRVAQDNSTSILTGVGAGGTVVAAVLTGRASFKAAEVFAEDEKKALDRVGAYTVPDLKTRIKLVWPLYIPAVGVGTLTITSIIMANRLNSRQAAAMAAAVGISERAFAEYRDKVVEKLGQAREQKVRDEIAQDRVTRNPPSESTIIVAGEGGVLCMDAHSGRYFMCPVDRIRKAENEVGRLIINHMSASLSAFYDEIGLRPTAYSNDIGWNSDNFIDVYFSSTLTERNEPCLVVDFRIPPIAEYDRLF